MHPVYISILIIFTVYSVAQLSLASWLKEDEVFSYRFSSNGEVEVRPDLARITMARQEPLASSSMLGARAVERPVEGFTKELTESFYTKPLKLRLTSYENSDAVARAFAASKEVVITTIDINMLPTLIANGLNSGLNVISGTEFSISAKKIIASRQEARKLAKDRINSDAAMFAAHLGRTLLRCQPPSIDIYLDGAGDPVVSGGMAMTEAPDTEEISKFIRPLSEFVIEEPDYVGTIEIAKTILPRGVLISESETLECDFR